MMDLEKLFISVYSRQGEKRGFTRFLRKNKNHEKFTLCNLEARNKLRSNLYSPDFGDPTVTCTKFLAVAVAVGGVTMFAAAAGGMLFFLSKLTPGRTRDGFKRLQDKGGIRHI
jgi:hypothetical protein